MTCAEFITACRQLGWDAQRMRELDNQIAEALRVEQSTARRWRLGITEIPGPVAVAMELMLLRAEIDPEIP